MTRFNLDMPLEKWLHQNRAEIVEVVEGVLLDNFLVECKRGIAVIYAKYVSAWASRYVVYFAPDRKGDDDGLTEEQYQLWDRFMVFADEAAREAV